MSTLFFDTSALLKRYMMEVGSAWVMSLVVGHNTIVVSEITAVELASVIARNQRGNIISAQQASVLQNLVAMDFVNDYLEVEIDKSLLREAKRLVSLHYLRSLDGIQLAAAVQARQVLGRPIVFVAADRRLLSAAAAEGFATDDPNNHA